MFRCGYISAFDMFCQDIFCKRYYDLIDLFRYVIRLDMFCNFMFCICALKTIQNETGNVGKI